MSTKEKEVPKTEEVSSLEEQTQPTKSQEEQPTEESTIDPNYVSSLEQRLAEQQIQYRRLEKLIDTVKEKKEEAAPTPKARNVEEERNSFYQDPVGVLNDRDTKILKQMEKMLEPIRMVASSFQNDNEYKNMKMMVRRDPYFAKGLQDPDIESVVDSIMTQPGVEINEHTIKSAISQAVGMKQLGMLGSSVRPNPNPAPNLPGERIDPPHVRTNRTRVTKDIDVRKELTEDDRLAMKIAGLKPGNPEHEKQYWELISDDTMVLPVHTRKEG